MKMSRIVNEFSRAETALGGASLGMAGAIYGIRQAQKEIQKVPVETVTLRAWEKPVLVEKTVEGLSAKAPVIGSDGSITMEKVQPQNMSGHGKPIVTEETHNIQEPTGIRRWTTFIKAGKATIPVSHRAVTYKTIGSYTQPHVDFDSGVSVLSNMLKYSLLGATIGAISTAVILALIEKD